MPRAERRSTHRVSKGRSHATAAHPPRLRYLRANRADSAPASTRSRPPPSRRVTAHRQSTPDWSVAASGLPDGCKTETGPTTPTSAARGLRGLVQRGLLGASALSQVTGTETTERGSDVSALEDDCRRGGRLGGDRCGGRRSGGSLAAFRYGSRGGGACACDGGAGLERRLRWRPCGLPFLRSSSSRAICTWPTCRPRCTTRL